MRAALLALALLCALGASQATAAGDERKPIPVTFVGDSIAASITYVPGAQAQLRKGLAVRFDLEVCRRLVQPSCSLQGETPRPASSAPPLADPRP